MNEIRYTLPAITLRGMAVLPEMVVHFDVSREKSITALEAAMEGEQNIFLITQKDAAIEEPGMEDLYTTGTVAKIKQIVKLQKEQVIRVLVEGKFRAHLEEMIKSEPYYEAEVLILEEDSQIDLIEEEAALTYLKSVLNEYAQINKQVSQEMVLRFNDLTKLSKLVTSLCNEIPFEYRDRQKLLEATDLKSRYEILAALMTKQVDILKITKEISEKVKERIDKHQREYVLREQLKVLREELGEDGLESDAAEFEERLTALDAPEEVKEKIKREIERFKNAMGNPSESGVIRTYIETVLDLPWNKKGKDNDNINEAEKILQEDHYGLMKVKERIIEYLSVRLLTKKGDAPILCLVGPPGTGKTSIARSVARALNKSYVRISLGGVHDESEIRGHRKTYIGAMPGRIAQGLKQAGVSNPVMLLDEVDKIGSDYKGDPFAALLEVLDSEQNNKFRDNYVEIPLDLSEVLFIATANSVQTIPRPLLDRMDLIEINSYTENEKFHIARNHLIPKQLEHNGLKPRQMTITDSGLHKLISEYTREAGVRNLERRIGDLCRKTARVVLGEAGRKSVKVSEKSIEKYLGKPRYTHDMAFAEPQIGIVRGLAWTSVGGDTLSIEVNVMPGKGRFELTGQLGDVMKESAHAGISYIRSTAKDQGIKKTFFDEHDIHIHIPEGAVPKDGPSAGITMATAMISAITERPVRADIAMTGEITLRGRVLPIGGLKEKILAAKMAGIKLVIVPVENKRDIEELEAEITEDIKIVFASTMEDVLKWSLKM
jgi:ATP-dependent Lon protease